MNNKMIRLTESDLKQIVKESVNRIVKESDELDANDWKARYLKNAHYPNEPVDMKDIENKASWEAFDDNVNSLYGQRGCYDDDYASQAYADDPLSDFYGLENKNTYDLKGYLAKRKLNKLAKNESKDMNKKLIRLTEGGLHRIVKKSVNKIMKEAFDVSRFGDDTLEQIDNMRFTDAQKMILNYALELEERGFSDEEYYELAFFFAEHNGLNESKRIKKTN